MAREGEARAETRNDGDVGFKMKPGGRRLDAGSAARFFYCAKADRADRNGGLADPGPQFMNGSTMRDAENVGRERKGNFHPTVKPTDLMRYLCRLVTPAGGIVLDPFMGSGSTLKAAELEGFSAIGIERDPDYVEIARRRIAADIPLFREFASGSSHDA
jgi:site-specific DNA-methyltransferase (adenine-specific)